jgi:hypothetical protein
MRLLIFAFLAICSTAIAAETQQITFTSSDGFSVTASAVGEVHNERPFLKVVLQNAVLRKNPRFPRPERVASYRIGIAYYNGTPGWDTKSWSESVTIDKTLFEEQTIDLGKPVFKIPIDKLPSLHDSWLVIEVTLTQNDGSTGKTYAHSGKLTFR